MARQKTNKTAAKRFKQTNPKGNRKAKVVYMRSSRNHLLGKKSSRARNRLDNTAVVSDIETRKLRKAIVF